MGEERWNAVTQSLDALERGQLLLFRLDHRAVTTMSGSLSKWRRISLTAENAEKTSFQSGFFAFSAFSAVID